MSDKKKRFVTWRKPLLQVHLLSHVILLTVSNATLKWFVSKIFALDAGKGGRKLKSTKIKIQRRLFLPVLELLKKGGVE